MKFTMLIITLMLFGCSENKEIVYVDSNGTPINKYKHKIFEQEIVCNEFGMAYYANKVQDDVIYTPVVATYYTNDNDTNKYDAPFISCENYDIIKDSK